MGPIEHRLKRLEELLPEQRRRRRPVPTRSFVEFVKGLLAGQFGPADIDRTNYGEMQHFNQFGVLLAVLSPGHQRWCQENAPWAARDTGDALEREGLGALTTDERLKLQTMAAAFEALKDTAR